MMEWTDRHCRYFLRLLAPRARLYTEMITSAALLHGDQRRLLAFDAAEQPLALQLGGSEAPAMAAAARLGEQAGYAEVNINCGCPSPRVLSGAFGACLMREPNTVAECVSAMTAAVSIPVTVKSRIGVDGDESFDKLCAFVTTVAAAGCRHFIVHARSAWLDGLSPRQNRDVPPLRHELVHALKREFPTLSIIVNGGIASLEDVRHHLCRVDGVMLGREAYHNPWQLAQLDRALFGARGAGAADRPTAVRAMLDYIERELADGTRLASITRHMLGLFRGQPGARAWRRHLSMHAHRAGAGVEVVRDALAIATVSPPVRERHGATA